MNNLPPQYFDIKIINLYNNTPFLKKMGNCKKCLSILRSNNLQVPVSIEISLMYPMMLYKGTHSAQGEKRGKV